MKIQELFSKLKMNKQDDFSLDFYRANIFFEDYKFFINSIFEKSSNIEITKIFNNTKPVHYARILPISSFLTYEKAFSNFEYKLVENFRSTVIEKHLKEKYLDDNIISYIKKIRNKKNQEIEIFLIENGLNNKEIARENLLLRHFAIESKKIILNDLEKALLLNEFKNVGSGSNKEEKSSITYYEKSFDKSQLIRLELFKKNE